MSAEAGPGPSTMASSPIVPDSAKNLRIKKRMINIVNPADPDSFSIDCMSVAESPEKSLPTQRKRDDTPMQEIGQNTPAGGTPLGGEMAKRGILRPSGTPGSGNGVRFFPKNRFRVITPNNSISQHPASPASKAASIANTPERRKQSLLTQLLAVAMPSVSPEKPPPVLNKDDSWEQPGQEGEISLVASSTMVTDDEEYDVEQSLHQEEAEGDSWNGMPVIISSPLNLPEGDGSRDISLHELNPGTGVEVSADWGMMVPDDMSNLLSEKWSPTDPSFSISDPPPSTISRLPRPTRDLSASPRLQSSTPDSRPSTSPTGSHLTRAISPISTSRASPNASAESNSTDILATVRKRVSPVKYDNTDNSFVPLAPSTPTPAPKPIGSIFAEMSAEQADMSWPLRGDDDDSPLHSAVFTHDASALISLLPPFGVRSEQKSSTPQGDKTQFFDCSSSGFDLSPLARSKSVVAYGPPGALAQPTKELFEAQNEHARALVEEVKLYRDLATRLHTEVVERDSVLADLNGRLLDTEALQTQVADLRDEVVKLRARSPMKERSQSSPLELSSSPLAARSGHAGDRTTVVQAETRDLEIRLSKALAEHDTLRKQVAEVHNSNEAKTRELQKVRQEMADLEDRHRDQLITLRQSPPLHSTSYAKSNLQADLDNALSRCSALEIDVTKACDRADDLTNQVQEMRQVKAADETEIDRLTALVEGTRESRKREEEMRSRLEEMERRVQAETRRSNEMEQYLRDERLARKRLEQENRDLVKSLQTTQAQLAQRSVSPLKQDPRTAAEIARLRSESASKDLEIVNLQRRKNELKEDREMLNIALDSKQQELELIKRKFAVKGVAGATPLGLSTKVNHNMQETPAGHATPAPGHKSRRRSSMNHFITPSIVNGDKRALRSSAMLNSLAVPAGRVDENTPASRYGSLKRGGERAPA